MKYDTWRSRRLENCKVFSAGSPIAMLNGKIERIERNLIASV